MKKPPDNACRVQDETGNKKGPANGALMVT